MQLIHKRALFDHIRKNQLRGQERDQIFSAFYGPKDIRDAILMEHRQYMLSVSSHVSADHLINVMHDRLGKQLLGQYKMLFTNQFDLYGYIIRCDDAVWANAVQPLMAESRKQIADLRQRTNSERPDNRYADFDRQALLAQSGRYPILEYMVG